MPDRSTGFKPLAEGIFLRLSRKAKSQKIKQKGRKPRIADAKTSILRQDQSRGENRDKRKRGKRRVIFYKTTSKRTEIGDLGGRRKNTTGQKGNQDVVVGRNALFPRWGVNHRRD